MNAVSTVHIALFRVGAGGAACCVMTRTLQTKRLLDELASIVCMLADGTEMTVNFGERTEDGYFEYEMTLQVTPEVRREASLYDRASALAYLTVAA